MVLWCIVSALLVAADQISKYFAARSLDLGESVELIPKILNLTYVKNTGAAFSVFSNSTWFLSVLSLVFCVAVVVYMLWKKPENRVLRLSLMLIFSGALGNAIDRIFFGAVTDFIEVKFINFPVFNIADITITVGAAVLVIYELFFNPEDKKNNKDSLEKTERNEI